jgi:dTMP kinase
MKLVCITGIDGTGKTTLATNAAAALRQQGQPATYIYGRTCPVISRALMALGRVILLRKEDQWQDYEGYTARKKQTMHNPLFAWIYTAAILLDYYVQIWLKLLPHLASRRIVVSDRYLYDTVISDLAVHLNYTAAHTERAIQWGLWLLPKPLLTILIDVPEGIAFSRKDDIVHIDYLKERRGWYLALRDRPEVKLLDGQASPKALVKSLLRELAVREPLAVGDALQ